MKRKVYIYGFDSLHRIRNYEYLQGSDITIKNILEIASAMEDIGMVHKIYAVDNTRSLREDFWKSIKTEDFTQHIEFEDEVKRKGILINFINR